jgi:hypothetical protein
MFNGTESVNEFRHNLTSDIAIQQNRRSSINVIVGKNFNIKTIIESEAVRVLSVNLN